MSMTSCIHCLQIDLLKKRTYYDETLEEQNEECIEYIYNLISPNDHTTL